MAKESMSGPAHQEEIFNLSKKIISNRAFITKEDIKVLEFLGTKGEHEEKKVGFIDKFPDFMVELWDIYNELPRSHYPTAANTMLYFWKWVDENYTLVNK